MPKLIKILDNRRYQYRCKCGELYDLSKEASSFRYGGICHDCFIEKLLDFDRFVEKLLKLRP